MRIIGTFHDECDFCGFAGELQIIKEHTKALAKEKAVEYVATLNRCPKCNERWANKEQFNENLAKAKETRAKLETI